MGWDGMEWDGDRDRIEYDRMIEGMLGAGGFG